MRIEQIDIRNAAPRTYAALNAFLNETRAERLPDDPPVPLDEEIRRFQTIPAFIDLFAWIAAADGAGLAPAGAESLRRAGAHVGLESHTNQLELRDLNRDLIRRWQERAAERAAGFDLLVWTAGPPDEFVEPFAALVGAVE